VSFLGGLALWLSSLEVARRANYEVFYKLHHIGEWCRSFLNFHVCPLLIF
jgi:hypothetical protein